jgi:hypothetical protein
MAANRIAWSLTTAFFVLTSIALLVSGYDGYAGVFLAVAVAAAVNLIPFGKNEDAQG